MNTFYMKKVVLAGSEHSTAIWGGRKLAEGAARAASSIQQWWKRGCEHKRLLLFSCSALPDFLWPHGLQHARLPCPSPSPGACSNSCPLSQWCHPNISSSAVPFSSCLQSFPASGSFPMSQIFASGGQCIGASALASVLPMNNQGWFSSGLTGLISWLSKGLSRVCSSTTVQRHDSLVLNLSYCPALTSVHDYWKNHSFDNIDLCRPSNFSAF